MVKKEIKKTKNKSLLLFLAIILVLGSVLVITNPFKEEQLSTEGNFGTSKGSIIPNLEFTSFNGDKIKFSDFQGKGIIINVWAAWCHLCVNGIPDFQRFASENEDIKLILVHRTSTEGVGEAEQYVDRFSRQRNFENTPINVIDPNDNFYNTFFGYGMPVTLFVDKNGIIVDKKVGPMDLNEIMQRADKIMQSNLQSSGVDNVDIKITRDGVKYLIDPSKFLGSGIPQDGIPSIDNPKFVSIQDSDLDNSEVGLGINFNGVSKFYPHKIIIRHEIINDLFNGKPVLVTYCPLCFTGISFEREINGEVVEFGVSGRLYNSNSVMYDRKTDTYWIQSLGKAVLGELTGMELRKIQTDTLTFGQWRKLNPDTLVLSGDTGYPFKYVGDPYIERDYNYYTAPDVWFGLGNKDNRLGAKEIVHGIVLGGRQKAYNIKDIRKERLINDLDFGLAVFYDEESDISRFYLTDKEFELVEGEIFDVETRSKWNLDGEVIEGELKGKKLDKIVPIYGFWFNWAANYPDTELYAQN